MKKLHKNLYGMITFLLIVIIFWKYHRRKNRLSIYNPSINFTSITTPHEYAQFGRFLENRKTKTILLFTTHFYSEVWKGLDLSILDDYTKQQKCSIQQCKITYDKSAIKYADVVVFHGVDFTYKNFTTKHFQALSKQRPAYQRWVFWMHETPLYYPLIDDYDNLFNWTMTFSQRSDLYHPYYSYARINNQLSRTSYLNYASRKTKKVAWMVSHCGMTRASFAAELQKYTHVTVYGLCGGDFEKVGGICSYDESECAYELQQYKFYLAFENSFCEDYVTEKYYKFGLQYGLVPIVMGARYNHMNSVPGSYIDVTKFPSVKELGDYINYLDADDDAYNTYFEWRNHFEVTDGVDKICTLCHAAHNLDRGVTMYPHFHEFWSVENLCSPFEPVRNKLETQIAESKNTKVSS